MAGGSPRVGVAPHAADRPRENRKASGAVPEGGYCWRGEWRERESGRWPSRPSRPPWPPVASPAGGTDCHEAPHGCHVPRGTWVGPGVCRSSGRVAAGGVWRASSSPVPLLQFGRGKKIIKPFSLCYFPGMRRAQLAFPGSGRIWSPGSVSNEKSCKKPGISCQAETRRFDSPSAGSAARAGQEGQGTRGKHTHARPRHTWAYGRAGSQTGGSPPSLPPHPNTAGRIWAAPRQV